MDLKHISRGITDGRDRAGARGGWQAKLRVCLYSGLLILPGSLLMNSPHFSVVLISMVTKELYR